VRVALVNLTSGGLSGGYRKYLERMLPLLRQSPSISRLEILSPNGLDVPADLADGNWSWPENDGMWGYRALKAELARRQPHVVFVPSARLIATTVPSVVMVRNMEPLVAPFSGNSARDGFRNVGRRLVARASCRRATRVIAVSAFVRDFLVDHWRVGAAKVGVVPHGVETPLARSSWVKPKAIRSATSRPFIFAAGSIRPARGLEDLLGALDRLRDAAINPLVVIAGAASGDGQAYQQKLEKVIANGGHRDSVVWTGPLSQEEMAWCYGNCSVFAMTSRVEACPNTALEALAYGCLCVATTTRPMPEIFGDAAAYYEAGNAGLLADKIVTALRLSAVEKAALARRGVDRASGFTWETTANDTVQQLQLAANKK
jgi:glycosyltransferase involved in cell wall biosynthesis